ncbi:hypothetical protein D5086_004948 [Populus alba]|uniref:Uncharacterized protein n=2 Tax=Populus alba TaxID=43335 RepID=A0ACC4CRX1_POPAL|nr:hypothetical protein D5086_0000124840 [Populus alba]
MPREISDDSKTVNMKRQKLDLIEISNGTPSFAERESIDPPLWINQESLFGGLIRPPETLVEIQKLHVSATLNLGALINGGFLHPGEATRFAIPKTITTEQSKTQRVQFFSGPAFSNLQVVPSQNKQKQKGMAKTDGQSKNRTLKAGNSELRNKAVVSTST